MKIKVPNYIIVNGVRYKLFVEYRDDLSGKWIWKITYVGDTGILFMESDTTLFMVEKKVFEFIENNKYEYE